MAKGFPNVGATVIDTSADLTGGLAPSAALEGVMVFQKDTNELKICDGTNWRSITDTDSPPAYQMVNATVSGTGASASNGVITLSGATQFNVTCFSSEFNTYRALYTGTASASTATALRLELLNGATPKTSVNYYGAGWYSGYTSTSGAWGVVNSLAYGYFCDIENTFAIGNNVSAVVDFFRVNGEGTPSWLLSQFNMGRARNINGAWGYYETASITANTGFRLTVDGTGTVSGTLRIYGYRNSI